MTTTLESRIIPLRGNRRKCGGGWQHPAYEGPVQDTELHSFNCATCAATNLMRTPAIERHSRCGLCGAS